MKKLSTYLPLTLLLAITLFLSTTDVLAGPAGIVQISGGEPGSAGETLPSDDSSSPSTSLSDSPPTVLFEELQNNCKTRGHYTLCPPTKAFDFEPRITTGMMRYSYVDGLTERLKGTIPMVGGGLLIRFPKEKLVVDFYAQQSSTLKTGGFKKAFEGTGIDPTISGLQDQRSEREDYSVNIGYQLFNRLKNFWLFVGYKWNKTEIQGQNAAFFGNLPKELVLTNYGFIQATQIHLDTTGPFIGGKFQIPLGTNNRFGIIGINAALTLLSGDYSYEGGIEALSITATAKKYGQTYGIDWEIPLTNILHLSNLNLNISLNTFRYNMDVEMEQSKPNFPRSFSVKENIHILKAGFIFQF